jgi:hypothetical protein
LREWNHKSLGFGQPPPPKNGETKEEALRKWKKECALRLVKTEVMSFKPRKTGKRKRGYGVNTMMVKQKERSG